MISLKTMVTRTRRADDIVGYAYEAALHCPKCAEKRFEGQWAEGHPGEDNEGNAPSPVFASDEEGEGGDFCDDCHESLR
jgi:hypothetical protein